MKPLFFNLLTLILFTGINLSGQSQKVYNDLFSTAKTMDVANRNSNIHYLEINNKSLTDLFTNKQQSITLQLPLANDEVMEIVLTEKNIFTEDFAVLNSRDERIPVEKGRHFHGQMKDKAGSYAAISIYKDQIFGLMSDVNGNYNLGKIKGSEQYAFYNDRMVSFDIHAECTTKDKPLEFEAPLQENLETRSGKVVKLYVELDDDIISSKGSVQEAVNYATAMYNQVIALYARDAIAFQISKIKTWDTSSPYSYDINSDDKTGSYLESFQANSGSFDGHVAQLITFQDLGGGVATGFAALCASEPDSSKCIAAVDGSFENIPTFSWDVQVCTHEVGHLLGSRHTHACVWNGNNTAIDGCADYIEGECSLPGYPAEGGTIMSYCHIQSMGINLSLGFGTQPKNFIINKINNATCITDGGGGSLSVDPQFVEIPAEGGCESINVTSTGDWGAEYDPSYPPFFLTNAANIAGSGNGTIEFCAGKNTLPVPFYTVMYVYDATTEFPIIIRQDSVHAPTAVFYPGNEKISPFSGETFSLDILTNTDWKLVQKEYDQKWVVIKSSKSGTKNAEFTVEVKKNTTPLNRYSHITMIYNNGLDTTYFTISQPSENSGYLNVPDEFTAFKNTNTYSFRVSSDLDWEITYKEPWMTEVTPMKGKKDQVVTVTIDENMSGFERFGIMTFVAQTMTKDSIVKTVNVNQLDERSNDSGIKDRIYPNPTRDIVNIELSAEVEEKLDVRIFDAAGRLIKVLENSRPVFGAYYNTYQIADLAPGFYTMDIRHGSTVMKEKLVILN